MSLLIKLELAEPQKMEIWIRAHLIMGCQRTPGNPLITQVTTQIMTNKGPLAYSCYDSPESIAEAVNRALMAVPDRGAN